MLISQLNEFNYEYIELVEKYIRLPAAHIKLKIHPLSFKILSCHLLPHISHNV